MKTLALLLTALCASAAMAQVVSLESGVYRWKDLASLIPHALNNVGRGPTEYFAFQWQ